MLKFFEKQQSKIDLANFIFLCFFAVYTVLREVIPLKIYVGNSIFSAVVFAGCFGFMFLNFLSNKKYLKFPNAILFAAFVVVIGITTLINKDYAFTDNIKAILWTIVFFFYLYPTGYHLMSTKPKYIDILFALIVATLSILMLVSLPMYLYDIDYDFYKTTGAFTNQGFSNKYIRLWGVFQEANYGAVYCAVGLILAIYLFLRTKKILPRVLLVISSCMFMSFIVLSGSRTTQLVTIVISAWVAFYMAISKAKNINKKNLVITGISCVLSVSLYIGVFAAVKNVLPYVKLAVRNTMTYEKFEKIHKNYDDFYKDGDVNVVRGYYTNELNPFQKEPETTSPPSTTEAPSTTVSSTENQDSTTTPSVTEENTTIKPSIELPATPTLSTVESTLKGVKFTWEAVEGVDRYTVYRRTYDGKAEQWTDWTALNRYVQETSYVDQTAESGTYYKYTVKPHNEAGFGGYDKTGLKIQFLPPQKPAEPEKGDTVVKLDRTDLGKQDISNGRLERWFNALEIFKSAPIFGASPRGIYLFAREHNPDTTMAKYWYSISNVYLEILAETGIIGFIVIFLIMVKTALTILYNVFKQRFSTAFLIFSSIVLMLAGAAFLQSDLFFNLTFGGFMFWMLLGLVNNLWKFKDALQGEKND